LDSSTYLSQGLNMLIS